MTSQLIAFGILLALHAAAFPLLIHTVRNVR